MVTRSSQRVLLHLLLFVFGIVCPALAQTGRLGALRGSVSDPSGARIPGAKVVLHGPGGDQTGTADGTGQYSFTNLAAGSYDVNISAPDFKTIDKKGVEVSATAVLDVQLELDIVPQVITVEDTTAPVDLDPE